MKRWLAHYDADVAPTLVPYPDRTLLDYLADLARSQRDTPALLFKGASMSYGELEQQSDAFAAALASIGVRPGDRIALLLPNCPQFMVAQYGIWKAGGIVVALNPIYSERELEAALDVVWRLDRHRAHALLSARQECPGADAGSTRHRHIDQGIPPGPAADPLHAVQGKEGRPSGHARQRRSLVAGSAAGAPILATAGGHGPAR